MSILFNVGPPLKKKLFPAQRVAEILASKAAAKSFFFSFFFGGGGKKMMKLLTKKIFFLIKKKSSHSAVICSPGRWTGNNFFLRVAWVGNHISPSPCSDRSFLTSFTTQPGASIQIACLYL